MLKYIIEDMWGGKMFKLFYDRFKEAISSIVPVMIIMLIVSFLLGFNIVTIITILFSTLLLIFGITLFSLGASLSMMEIGKFISSKLLNSRRVWLIFLVSFIVGIVITIAEPDLKVLASQMTAINDNLLIILVGLGVGLFLSVAAVRIVYQVNIKKIIFLCYMALIFMLFISNKQIIPLAFDSGGVTTGPISVPFILSLGIGFSSFSFKKKSSDDSFGLIALCSIGPILVMLLMGLFMKSDFSYNYNISDQVTDFSIMISNFLHEIIPITKDVLVSLFPIVSVYIIFVIVNKVVLKRQILKIFVGFIITLIGVSLFFIGVNAGYLPIAYLIGIHLFDKIGGLLVVIGFVIGFVIVKAEPAVSILTEQIEILTDGSIKRKVMNNTIAIGVGLAVALSIFRLINGISIIPFLIFGYLIVLILMFFSPNIFTMVSFDSGGAVTGPMTTSFLLPFIIGICYACDGNVLTDAFGLVAFVAMSPLITIQLLGIIFKYKQNKVDKMIDIDESIVDFKVGD